ncbi:MAG: hypothetical protein KatS3mg052_2498 [Candidatus Roseilinea sp.]|nr:MAG: hypothetical protein KatS3mg052_2498 [Candidatus Roseilinea sp.]
MSVTPGFLLAAEDAWQATLSTGLSDWTCKLLDGYAFGQFERIPWKGGNTYLDGRAYPWGVERGEGEDWLPAQTLRRAMTRRLDWELPPQHILTPAALPPMQDETCRAGVVRLAADVATIETRDIPIRRADHDAEAAAAWQAVVRGEGEVVIPPRTITRVLIDLQDYYLAYTTLTVSGGAERESSACAGPKRSTAIPTCGTATKASATRSKASSFWAMAISTSATAERGARSPPLWWSAGRYVEVVVQTFDAPLTIHTLVFRESRYPLEMASAFEASDARLNENHPHPRARRPVHSQRDVLRWAALGRADVSRRHATGSAVHLRDERRRPAAAQGAAPVRCLAPPPTV